MRSIFYLLETEIPAEMLLLFAGKKLVLTRFLFTTVVPRILVWHWLST